MREAIIAALVALLVLAGAAQAGIVTRTVEYHHGDWDLLGYVAFDDALPDRRPGVLVAHVWAGPRPFMQEQAQRLARLGYVGLVTNIYSTEPGDQARMTADVARNRALLLARAAAALERLQRQPQVDPARLAAVGFGVGGATVLDLAGSGAPLAGVVSVDGVLDAAATGAGGSLRARVLLLQGAEDREMPPDRMRAFLKRVESEGTDWQMVLYGGAGQGFANPEGASFDPKAERRAWAAMGLFFAEVFGEEY
jgi:dienelactone hydrolase